MWFRDYNPRLGRFLQVDPLAGDIGDPQSLNRYAYVLGNPVNFIDPLGLFSCGFYVQYEDDDGRPAGVEGFFCGGGTKLSSPKSGPESSGGGGPCTFMDWANGTCGRGVTPAPIPQMTRVPVHGIWTYGNWCGAEGSGKPIDQTDEACKAHDECFERHGFTPGSIFQGPDALVQECNQKLCDTVKRRLDTLIKQREERRRKIGGWVFDSPSGPKEPGAAADIIWYFKWVIAPWGNSCQ